MKDLKLSLIVEALDRATAPMRKIAGGLAAIEARATKVGHAFKKLGMVELFGGAALIGAATEGARGIWELTRGTAEFGVEALHAAQKASMTVEQIQKLQFAAKMTDVDADSLGETMFRFNQHVISAAMGSKREERALKAMGVQIKDTHHKLKPLYELFLEFSDSFSKMDSRVANFAAFTMLGRGGVRSIPLLKLGREGLIAFGKQAEAMGVIMDQDTAERAEGFMQHMKLVGMAVDGIKMRLGIQLMPVMDAFLVRLTTMIVHLQPSAVRRFSDAIGGLIDHLPQLLVLFERGAIAGTKLADRLLDLSNHAGVVKGVLIGLGALLGLQLIVGFFELAFAVGAGITAFVGFVDVIGSLIALAAGVTSFADAMALLDIALDANPIGIIVLAIGALIAVIALVGVGVFQIYKHWSGITAWFAKVWKTVQDIFSAAWKVLSDLTPDWLKTLLKLAGLGIALTVKSVSALAAPFLGPHAPPPGAAPGHPGAGGARKTPAMTRIHLHMTSDGKIQVKSVDAGGGAEVSFSRGVMPA